MEDTTFAGYDIPKDTVIIFHLYSALMDPNAWDHPEEFKPERFLNQNGEFDDKKESFIPFSIGKFQLNLKGTATLMISMFYQKELYERLILIQVSSKSVEKLASYGHLKNLIWLTFSRCFEYLISF